MRLSQHPGFLDGWPGEPGGAFERRHVAPLDGADVLVEAYLQRTVGSNEPSIALRTLYQGSENTRDMRASDDGFAEAMVRFLNLNTGRTTTEIGELEVDF
jgi:hypothetical protein